MQNSTEVLIKDKESPYNGMKGKIVACYDRKIFKNDYAVYLPELANKYKHEHPKKTLLKSKGVVRFNYDQLLDLTNLKGKDIPLSRGDLYRKIKNKNNSSDHIVETIRKMRDLGLIEFNIPAN